MTPEFRASFMFHRQLRQIKSLRNPQFFLAILAAVLITAVACGTDRAGGDNGVAASSFQVEGDTLTWAPPWEAGDTRTVNITSSFELSAAAQEFLDSVDERHGDAHELPGEQSSTVGTISIISTGSNGSTGELNIAIEELIAQLDSQGLEQPGFGEADLSQLTSLLGLTDLLDLGVEFGIGADGSLTGVTNLEELAATVNEFVDSFLKLRAFAGEGTVPDEGIQELRTLLEELPKTEAAKLAADSGLNLVTANLFLMRSGDYTVGQPVDILGKTPTIIGLTTDGRLSYELTGISDGTATVQVQVVPGDVDLIALMEQLAVELAAVVGEDAGKITEGLAELEADERSQIEALSGVLFNPYTVTLTLDADTGWVTGADWSFEFSFPEGFEELIDEEDRDFEDFELTDLGATVNVSATFE